MWRKYGIIGVLALGSIINTAPAMANDWGCQVLLCLSNPGGATQYKECVAPIKKLYQALAKGKAFPTCTAGTGNGSVASNMRYGVERFEDCPKDYKSYGNGRLSQNSERAGQCYKDRPYKRGDKKNAGEVFIINGAEVPHYNSEYDSFPEAIRTIVQAKRRTQPNYIEYTLNGQQQRHWW